MRFAGRIRVLVKREKHLAEKLLRAGRSQRRGEKGTCRKENQGLGLEEERKCVGGEV